MGKEEAAGGNRGLGFLNDVGMRVAVEFGRATTTIRKMLAYQKGSVIELEKMSGEPLDVRLNGKLVARGEAVIVNDRFGVRVTEIISPEDMVVDSASED